MRKHRKIIHHSSSNCGLFGKLQPLRSCKIGSFSTIKSCNILVRPFRTAAQNKQNGQLYIICWSPKINYSYRYVLPQGDLSHSRRPELNRQYYRHAEIRLSSSLTNLRTGLQTYKVKFFKCLSKCWVKIQCSETTIKI